MISKEVYNTSKIFEAAGVKHSVFSPGSRNAPLTLSFARNDKIKKWIIPDERAAGFIALGIAQKTGKPVVLCCTSGTALLNYAPAVAEAFYREIPLIVLSADRPPELIDQRDGQTIRQFEVLKNHVLGSYQMPIVIDEDSALHYRQHLTRALADVAQLPGGPIHINVPFREPFYPEKGDDLTFSEVDWTPVISERPTTKLPSLRVNDRKVLILVGQKDPEAQLDDLLQHIADKVPIIQSPLSNLTISGIQHIDVFLDDQPELRPDVLITYGLSVLSKKLKSYLRKYSPNEHYHFDPAEVPVDTFQSKPTIVKASLGALLKDAPLHSSDPTYREQWATYSERARDLIDRTPLPFSETSVFKQLLTHLPDAVHLHLSNSMPVRFAELFGVPNGVTVWSNRGTSGIDGCSSTAVGTCLVSDHLNLLVTGDLAFLYDRNAFFHNYALPNLRVIISNNQGGGIFRLIDGPAGLPELEDYFETRHNRTAEYICAENEMTYLSVKNQEELQQHLQGFFEPSSRPKVMEIFTDPSVNQEAFRSLKQQINEQLKN